MATEKRAQADRLALYQALAEKPYNYGFYTALRNIENANMDKAKFGRSNRPADDPVRLGQEPSMAFAPSTLASFNKVAGSTERLNVLFFGVFGPNGPLPLHLTEYARDRVRNHQDESLSHFADIFHHRLLSLFYRVWADSEPTVNFDRPNTDEFSIKVASLIGLGEQSLRNCDAMPDYAKLHFSGRFAQQNKNAEGLLAILRSYFSMPAQLEQYIGNWLTIPDADCLRLGESIESGSLGENSTLGEKVWECQNKFRLCFGPLNLIEYQRLLPGGASLVALIAIVRNYLGDEFDWDVQLKLEAEQVKPACLGVFGQLGWTTWMSEAPPAEDFDQLHLNPLLELI
ncbi:MAG: type VI secretion system baseplate subunit TssG [Oceanospirillaceae bacterium]|nr:type VI secretion system baseplate subunit TssG [Oceanospirillaceae bacterium]